MAVCEPWIVAIGVDAAVLDIILLGFRINCVRVVNVAYVCCPLYGGIFFVVCSILVALSPEFLSFVPSSSSGISLLVHDSRFYFSSCFLFTVSAEPPLASDY